MDPHVSIIILNWNSWRYTLECLDSLLEIDYPNYSIIVVDNGSSNNSINQILHYCKGKIPVITQKINKSQQIVSILDSLKLKINGKNNECLISKRQAIFLIENDQNYGFAEGNNIGIRFSFTYFPSDYILLLNNDTIVQKEFLKNLVRFSEQDPAIGFAGPKIFFFDDQGKSDVINHAGGLLNMWTGISIHRGEGRPDSQQYNKLRDVDYLTGACLLVKRSVIEKIGLMNPDYFLYWEETDWCTRGKRAGFTSIYVPLSRIWHRVGSAKPGPTFYYYYTRNRFWFMLQNATSIQRIFFYFYFFGIEIWFNLIRITFRGDVRISNLDAFLKGICAGIIGQKKFR